MSDSRSSSRQHGGAHNAQNDSNSSPAHTTEARGPRTEQELAQAFRDLARGEQTATALEANLTSLESKLDQLIASIEQDSTYAALSPVASGDEKGTADGKATADK